MLSLVVVEVERVAVQQSQRKMGNLRDDESDEEEEEEEDSFGPPSYFRCLPEWM